MAWRVFAFIRRSIWSPKPPAYVLVARQPRVLHVSLVRHPETEHRDPAGPEYDERSQALVEEAVGVPFVVRYDPMIEEARSDEHLVLNIDFAPTLAELAGVEPEEVEGRSLLPLLRGSGERWRHAFLIEHLGKHERSTPTFCAIHTARYVLVRFATGEEELYDLVRDPSQMTNRVGRRG